MSSRKSEKYGLKVKKIAFVVLLVFWDHLNGLTKVFKRCLFTFDHTFRCLICHKEPTETLITSYPINNFLVKNYNTGKLITSYSVNKSLVKNYIIRKLIRN